MSLPRRRARPVLLLSVAGGPAISESPGLLVKMQLRIMPGFYWEWGWGDVLIYHLRKTTSNTVTFEVDKTRNWPIV